MDVKPLPGDRDTAAHAADDIQNIMQRLVTDCSYPPIPCLEQPHAILRSDAIGIPAGDAQIVVPEHPYSLITFNFRLLLLPSSSTAVKTILFLPACRSTSAVRLSPSASSATPEYPPFSQVTP